MSSTRSSRPSASRSTTRGPIFDVPSKKTRIAELEEQAASPSLWDDPDSARTTLAELARLKDDVELVERLAQRRDDLAVLAELADEEDDDASRAEVRDGVAALRKQIADLEVRTLLGGEYDERDAILSVHPGAGGTESQDWASMLFRMYLRWAERRGFATDLIEYQEGEEAGIKTATAIVKGRFAYGMLSGERGVHRLVRISPYDAAKRRHTSFAAVDIVPVMDESVEITIKDEDIRVDVYRSSGPGGQSVNTTDSAVRITHMPTGIVVTSQNERSQLQNKATAMRVLQAKLAELMRQEQVQKLDELRGERRDIAFGSQIRNYVLHPYQLVKDQRSGYETSGVNAVLEGDIDDVIRSCLEWRRAAAAGA